MEEKDPESLIEPTSPEGREIVESVRVERVSIKLNKKQFNCAVLGPTENNENHDLRCLIKGCVEDYKHLGFFPETVTKDHVKEYLKEKGTDPDQIEVIANDTFTRKQWLITNAELVFILVESPGTIAEFVDCFRDIPHKSYAFIDENKFNEKSEIGMRCKNIIEKHGSKRICLFKDRDKLKKLVKATLLLEVRDYLRNG